MKSKGETMSQEVPSWYQTGYTGMRREEERLSQLLSPNRLWIPAGAKKEVVFTDDEPVCIYEHNPKIGGEWKNWLTCLSGCSDDVVCCDQLGSNSKYYVGYYTICDASEYIDKKGNKHQYEMKFLPSKWKTLNKLKMKKEDRGGFAGCLYSVIRSDEKSPSCGDDFEFKRTVDMERLFDLANYRGKRLPDLYAKARADVVALEALKKVFRLEFDANGNLIDKIVPFNYAELLKPKSPKEVRDLLRAYRPDGEEPLNGGGDIPF
jgi:hypothetical protein